MAIELVQLGRRHATEPGRQDRLACTLAVAKVHIGAQRLVALDKFALHWTHWRVRQIRAQDI